MHDMRTAISKLVLFLIVLVLAVVAVRHPEASATALSAGWDALTAIADGIGRLLDSFRAETGVTPFDPTNPTGGTP